MNNSKQCKICHSFITYRNKSNICISCKREITNQEKIKDWIKNGNTGNSVNSTIRNCIRDYILKQQNFCCAICHISNKWNGKELKFILDHIDGDASNNYPYNLRLVCPNCDSQLDTYKSKNKKSSRNSNLIDKRCRKICQLDKNTMKIISTFQSITEASKQMNCNPSAISSCLIGRNKTGVGYIWKYID